MAFLLNGTHIEGSTFNNVSGNMSQVYNTHVVHADDACEERPLVEGAHNFPATTTIHGSIGPIRTQRALHNPGTRPYVHDLGYHHGHQRAESSQPHMRRDGWGSLNTIHPVIEHFAPADPRTQMATYSPQLHSPPGLYSSLARVALAPEICDEMNGHHEPMAPLHSSQSRRPLQNYYAPVNAGIRTTFNSVGGDMTQLSVTSYGASGIDLLSRYVAMEALHDSGERFPEPACHPGTRAAILEQLQSWSSDSSPESTIKWLHGSAGAGKSAIAQMFAGNTQREGRLGASFFFKRGHAKRGTWHSLIPTIAYQLATSVPELLLPIQQAMEGDKLVVGRAMSVAFQRLLVEPFQNTQILQTTPVLVLDGLDECADHKVQQQILRLFICALRDHQLPIRLLISSRPEPHLREVLETKETSTICQYSSLSADESAYEDIRTYLRDELSRIQSESMTRGINLGPDWPSLDAVDRLVKISSGTFIYATTVIRFIEDEYHHPADRLESVLKLDPGSTAPLDDLYTEILSVVPPEQETQQLRILHIISKGRYLDEVYFQPEEIDVVLNLRGGTCRLILRRLHSLFSVPPIPTRFGSLETISILHASLTDYLSDARRSGQWCISLSWLQEDCLHCMLRLLSTPPQTDSQHHLWWSVVDELPDLLRNAVPCDTLIDLLRNRNVQYYLFLAGSQHEWPQRGSPYPSDLIQMWEDQSAIALLLDRSYLSGDSSAATFKYDSIYTEVFSENPDLLFFTQCAVVGPQWLDVRDYFQLFGWTAESWRPFLKFTELFFDHDGDSALDFVADPCRAKNLYAEPCHIGEEVALRWISGAKRVLAGGPCELYPPYLQIIEECQTSGRLLRELETFDLSEFCGQMAIDPPAHERFHQVVATEQTVFGVLNWLQSFPDNPSPLREAIEFWLRQIDDIRRCCRYHGWDSNDT